MQTHNFSTVLVAYSLFPFSLLVVGDVRPPGQKQKRETAVTDTVFPSFCLFSRGSRLYSATIVSAYDGGGSQWRARCRGRGEEIPFHRGVKFEQCVLYTPIKIYEGGIWNCCTVYAVCGRAQIKHVREHGLMRSCMGCSQCFILLVWLCVIDACMRLHQK
jgi:hypothetical protein